MGLAIARCVLVYQGARLVASTAGYGPREEGVGAPAQVELARIASPTLAGIPIELSLAATSLAVVLAKMSALVRSGLVPTKNRGERASVLSARMAALSEPTASRT